MLAGVEGMLASRHNCSPGMFAKKECRACRAWWDVFCFVWCIIGNEVFWSIADQEADDGG